MTLDWTLGGLPKGLAMDAWWLSDPACETPSQQSIRQGLTKAPGRGPIALLALVGIGDFLFHGRPLGMSLAVFAGAVFLVVLLTQPARERLRPSVLLVLSALPVIEHVQALSIAFLLAGICASLLWARGGTETLLTRSAALLASLPLRGARDGLAHSADLAASDALRGFGRSARSWAFPMGGALVLMGLLLLANPLLTRALSNLLGADETGILTLGRVTLWLGLALGTWPLIAPPPAAPTGSLPALPTRFRPGVQSVARGLLVFNGILAFQSATDAVYLWGGASLPVGMSSAEYAHRGAYPLLVTALLAGGFALAARPFAREDRRLRGLLLLWLAQNMALVFSALLRLEIYVQEYSLTYLRIHSAIWMALVAAGLGLIAWQVWRDRTNSWLITRTAGLGVATLYAACFVNFADIIAAENLSRADLVDDGYVCSLGPTAAAAILASGKLPLQVTEYGEVGLCRLDAPTIQGWRDWGFRNWRVRRYLEALREAGDENPRRG